MARGDALQALPASPGDGNSCRNLICFLSLSASLSALLAFPLWAARWEIEPSLNLEEIYTDNVSLAGDAFKQSDWVTQITPGIRVNATGPRLRFNVNYAPQLVYYAEEMRDDQVFQRGNAVGTAELARQLLFLEAGGRVDQYDISLRGPVSISNVNTTANRATVSTYNVSPYLQRDFGSAARGEARFTYSSWDSDDPTTFFDNKANRVNLRLQSGPAYKLLTWDVTYKNEIIKYETQQETSTEVTLANARRLITPTVGLLAQAGYESYDIGIPGAEREGSRWGAGLEWSPTTRTRLAATAGERFFGTTYYFDFRHRSRLTTWSAGYTEDVTTARDQFFIPATDSTAGALGQLFLNQISDPIARQRAVEEFISRTGLPPSLGAPVNFFSDQLFLVKRTLASASFVGVRNTVVANAFRENRDALTPGVAQPGTGDFATSNSIAQTGGGLVWNWRVTPRSTWNVGARYSRNEFLDTDRVDDLLFVQIGLTRQFQPRLAGSLHYRRQQNDSSVVGGSYTENAGIAALQMRF